MLLNHSWKTLWFVSVHTVNFRIRIRIRIRTFIVIVLKRTMKLCAIPFSANLKKTENYIKNLKIKFEDDCKEYESWEKPNPANTNIAKYDFLKYSDVQRGKWWFQYIYSIELISLSDKYFSLRSHKLKLFLCFSLIVRKLPTFDTHCLFSVMECLICKVLIWFNSAF